MNNDNNYNYVYSVVRKKTEKMSNTYPIAVKMST